MPQILYIRDFHAHSRVNKKFTQSTAIAYSGLHKRGFTPLRTHAFNAQKLDKWLQSMPFSHTYRQDHICALLKGLKLRQPTDKRIPALQDLFHKYKTNVEAHKQQRKVRNAKRLAKQEKCHGKLYKEFLCGIHEQGMNVVKHYETH